MSWEGTKRYNKPLSICRNKTLSLFIQIWSGVLISYWIELLDEKSLLKSEQFKFKIRGVRAFLIDRHHKTINLIASKQVKLKHVIHF